MTDQYLVFDSVPDRSDGTLPPFDGGLATQALYQSTPAGNAPIIAGGAVSLNPSTPGTATKQGWYGQLAAGKRVTKLGVEFQWTENKPAVASGQPNGLNAPVTAFYASPMSVVNGVLQVPQTFAIHGGPARDKWHVDIPNGFFGPWPVFSGTFTPVLAINTRYTWVVEYTANDTVKITLPDGTVRQNCQHPNFGQAGSFGNYGFFEIWLGNAINESNLKISSAVAGFDQFYPNNATPSLARPAAPAPPPPPPPATAATYRQPVCRTDGPGPYCVDDNEANTWAYAHVAANPGHVVEMEMIVK